MRWLFLPNFVLGNCLNIAAKILLMYPKLFIDLDRVYAQRNKGIIQIEDQSSHPVLDF